MTGWLLTPKGIVVLVVVVLVVNVLVPLGIALWQISGAFFGDED